jgi:two-component system response regulator PilR (NtrC family)
VSSLNPPARILVVDDEPSLREFLSICLTRAGYEVECLASGTQAMARIDAIVQVNQAAPRNDKPFDLVLTDLTMPGVDGLALLRHVRALEDPPEVIMMTAFGTTDTAIEAIKSGAQDYLTKPFKVDELLVVVERALEKRALSAENLALRAHLQQGERLDQMIGRSPAMQRVFELIRRVAPTPANVLIIGESGTGKELVARALHQLSLQNTAPWVPVNCAAIPTQLLESELFGHKRGAFTGAQIDRKGLFETAGHGTIFLDEIGEIDLAMQAKLLRVLQERKIRPVGSSVEIPIHCRIVAATNRDLQAAVEREEFRGDLYFRLNVIQINLTPLRHRLQDIPPLIDHFFGLAKTKMQKPLKGLTHEAMNRLTNYPYPGNIRELQNLIERAVALEATSWLTAENLPPPAPLESQAPSPRPPATIDVAPHIGPAANGPRTAEFTEQSAPLSRWPELGITLEQVLSDLERRLITSALEDANGTRREAARLLGITMRSLRYRLEKLGLESEPDPSTRDDISDDENGTLSARTK